MSSKLSTSVSTATDSHCQHISPKGQRCHMLIDQNHRPASSAAHPTLCAYHAERLRVVVPPVDPEVLAAELLDDINSFTTPMRSISFSAISSNSSLASESPAVTPSPSPTSHNSSSPAKPPWRDNERQPNRRPPTKRNWFTSSVAFAKGVANLPHSALSNPPAPPRS